jgi:hypothetical protein
MVVVVVEASVVVLGRTEDVVVEASEVVVEVRVVMLPEVLELSAGIVTVVDTCPTTVLEDSLKAVVDEEAVWSEPLPRRPKYIPNPAPASTMTAATAMLTISPVRRGDDGCHSGM